MKTKKNSLEGVFSIGEGVGALIGDAMEAARVGHEGDVEYADALERGRSGVEKAAGAFSDALDEVNEERRRLGLDPLERPGGEAEAAVAGEADGA